MIKIVGIILLILFVAIILGLAMEFLKHWLIDTFGSNIALTVFIILEVILIIIVVITK